MLKRVFWRSNFPEEKKHAYFKKLMNSIDRKGMPELLEWMEEKGIYTQQASTRFHGNYASGLLDHKMNLYELFDYMCKMFNLNVSEDTKVICAFGHDLCKIEAYINGQWNPANNGNGHAKYSIELLEKFIELTPEEKEIIRFHMGMYSTTEFIPKGEYDLKELVDAYNKNKIAKLFYFADDMVSQFVDKSK